MVNKALRCLFDLRRGNNLGLIMNQKLPQKRIAVYLVKTYVRCIKF